MPQDLMMRCEQKRPYKLEGKKVWRWVDVAVSELSADGAKEVRCMHCHGQVKMRTTKASPQPDLDHKRREDSENCQGGRHYLGYHRLSAHPVE